MKTVKNIFLSISMIGIIMIMIGSLYYIDINKSALESEIAVNQLSDDITVNSVSRSVIKNNYITKVGWVISVIGLSGMIFIVLNKQDKENEKDGK